jgi:hypothetical protein
VGCRSACRHRPSRRRVGRRGRRARIGQDHDRDRAVGALVRPSADEAHGILQPDEVLVLTPSRASATALRDRLALAVGVATPGALARSIVAFGYQIVRAEAVHRGEPVPQLLTGPDEDQVIADLLAGDAEDEIDGIVRWPLSLPAAVRSTRTFRAELRALLAECAQLGVSADHLADLAARHGVAEWAAAASFSREYLYARDRMRGAHRDAAGLVREALGLVRTLPAGAPGLAALERLRAIVVDDAQELTLGGVELLEACRARAWRCSPSVIRMSVREASAAPARRTSRAWQPPGPCTSSTTCTAAPRPSDV